MLTYDIYLRDRFFHTVTNTTVRPYRSLTNGKYMIDINDCLREALSKFPSLRPHSSDVRIFIN